MACLTFSIIDNHYLPTIYGVGPPRILVPKAIVLLLAVYKKKKTDTPLYYFIT